ncbi:tartrate-resistant acid phosphatase type 5 [Eudromia elegans]
MGVTGGTAGVTCARLGVLLSVAALAGAGPAPGGAALQFLALGDWGGVPEPPFATPRQRATAAAMGGAAAALGADFVLALGDNFYYEGVRDERDPRFQATFERVFSAPSLRSLPWLVLAGNHDHEGNVTAQVAYSRLSPRWHFPHPYYAVRWALPATNVTVELLVLDTVLLCGGGRDKGLPGDTGDGDSDGDSDRAAPPPPPRDVSEGGAAAPPPRAARAQLRWLRRRLAAARDATYVLVAGHHPLWSAGEHGPAPCLVRWLRPLLRRHRVSAYVSGHDHDVQFLVEGGVAFVVSGAGNFMSGSRRHAGSVPPGSLRFLFGEPASPGAFAHVRLDGAAMSVAFLEASGRLLYRASVPPRHA